MVLASPEAAPAEDCGSPGLHAPFAHLEPRLQATLRGFRLRNRGAFGNERSGFWDPKPLRWTGAL